MDPTFQRRIADAKSLCRRSYSQEYEDYFLSADGRPLYARISTLPGASRTVLTSLRVEF